MTDPYKLVIHLLLLRLKLHRIRKWLPFASSADSEMLAEWFQTMLGRLYHAKNESFHIVLLLFGNLYVDDIPRYSKLHEQNGSVYSCKCFSFGCHSLNNDIFEDYILLSSCHYNFVTLSLYLRRS